MFVKEYLSRILAAPKPLENSVNLSAKEVIERQRPSALKWFYDPNAHIRFNKALASATDVEDPTRLASMHRAAANNRRRVQAFARNTSGEVRVVDRDNLVHAQAKAMQTGTIPIVSFNSSPTWFGGAFFEGKGDAAEEAVFYRSTAPALVKPFLQAGIIKLDEASGLFRYTQRGKMFLIGAMPMNKHQRYVMQRLNAEEARWQTQVMLTKAPLVYSRTPLVRYKPDTLYDDIEAIKTGFSTDLASSYLLHQPEDMIFFRPLFMAAANLSDGLLGLPPKEGETKSSAQLPVDWEDETFLKAWKADTRRRIAAELDTYLCDQLYQSHDRVQLDPLILGASGTGEYQNSPRHVAEIYAEELEKRSPYLSDVSFAILTKGFSHSSFDAFYCILDGMPLRKSKIDYYFMPHSKPVVQDKQQNANCLKEQEATAKTQSLAAARPSSVHLAFETKTTRPGNYPHFLKRPKPKDGRENALSVKQDGLQRR